MKPRYNLFKWLLLGVVALAVMAIVLLGCDQEAVAPSEEAPAGGVAPPVEEPAGAVIPPVEEPAGAVIPPVEEPAGAVIPPVEEPAGAVAPPVEEPAGAVAPPVAPPVEEPAGAVAPPIEEPAGEATPPPSPEVVTVDIILEVDSTNSEGVKFVAPETGSYTLTIIGGAYDYWEIDDPAQGFLGWRTRIDLYINRPVEWGARDQWGLHPTNSDNAVGPAEYSPSWGDAEAAGQGSSVSIHLNKNDYIIMIISDALDYYFDNSGIIRIRITGP